MAYGILSDEDKRRRYDAGGFRNLEAADLSMELDVSNLGVVGLGFAAMFSKLGVPIKTAIAPRVLETVHTLSPPHNPPRTSCQLFHSSHLNARFSGCLEFV